MKVKSLFAVGALLTGGVCGSHVGASEAPEPPDLSGVELVIGTWGSSWAATTQSAFVDPFVAETGAKVQLLEVGGGWAPKLEAQRQANNIEWDIIDGADSTSVETLIDEGFLEPLPADLKAELESVSVEGAVSDYGIVIGATSMLIACQEWVEKCPSNMEEYWDFENFPGRRSFLDHSYTLLPMAIQSLGTAPEDIYPIDLDVAFDRLAELRDSGAVITTSSDQAQQVLRSGEVDMSIAPGGRMFALNEEGLNLTISWGGAMVSPGFIVVLADSENKDAAWEYLRAYAHNPERQAEFATALSYSMASAAIDQYLDEQTIEQMATSHDATWVDPRWYHENREEISQRWQEFLLG